VTREGLPGKAEKQDENHGESQRGGPKEGDRDRAGLRKMSPGRKLSPEEGGMFPKKARRAKQKSPLLLQHPRKKKESFGESRIPRAPKTGETEGKERTRAPKGAGRREPRRKESRQSTRPAPTKNCARKKKKKSSSG